MTAEVSQQSQDSEKQQNRTSQSESCTNEKAAPNPVAIALKGKADPAEQSGNTT
jgi:hypothetical protein